jgi:hypothetical protein
MTEQLELFDEVSSAGQSDGCFFPGYSVYKAFCAGCRCDRCSAYRRNVYIRSKDKRCSVDGCPNTRIKGSRQFLCQEHLIESAKRCTFPGCQMARSSTHGRLYCDYHYRPNKFGRDCVCGICGSEFQVLKPSLRRLYELCDGCLRSHQGIITSARKHRVPVSMLKEYCLRRRCMLCKRVMDARRVCVDHDHQCCPGSYSCGKCVRGFVCNGCNTAVGHLESLFSRGLELSDLLDYINSRRAA